MRDMKTYSPDEEEYTPLPYKLYEQPRRTVYKSETKQRGVLPLLKIELAPELQRMVEDSREQVNNAGFTSVETEESVAVAEDKTVEVSAESVEVVEDKTNEVTAESVVVVEDKADEISAESVSATEDKMSETTAESATVPEDKTSEVNVESIAVTENKANEVNTENVAVADNKASEATVESIAVTENKTDEITAEVYNCTSCGRMNRFGVRFYWGACGWAEGRLRIR